MLNCSLIAVIIAQIFSYLTALERIFAVGYVPSIQDIMHCSSQTTGIAKTTFGGVQGKPVYHVIDIGGSRAGQRKWIHAFQHVSVVVFMAPISGYARCLFEDGTMVSTSPALIT